MFAKKRESDCNMALTVKLVITFDKPVYLGSTVCDRFDRSRDVTSMATTYPEFHTIEDIDHYYPFMKETPGLSSGKLSLTVTGNLSGIDINETFNDLDTFDSFLLENNILPPCAHKIGFCPLF